MGKAMAEHLSQLGYRVFATGRNPKHEDSRSYELIAMDVTKLETIRTAVDHIIEQCGQLDVLINNAGVGITGPVEETPLDAVRNTFETNYFGALAVMQHVLPIMRKQQGTEGILFVRKPWHQRRLSSATCRLQLCSHWLKHLI